MQDFLRDKDAVHESVHVYAGRYGSKEADSRDGKYPSSVHPIARTHPVTGETALYVNRAFTTRIKGLKPAESAAVLEFLYDHLESVDFQVRFSWEPGSVAMWDNRVTQHYAVWDYHPHVRHGHRVSVVGERPYR
jgi:taurine dioxygenase